MTSRQEQLPSLFHRAAGQGLGLASRALHWLDGSSKAHLGR